MRKTTRKFLRVLSTVLCVALMLSVLPMAFVASAAANQNSPYEYKGKTYTYTNVATITFPTGGWNWWGDFPNVCASEDLYGQNISLTNITPYVVYDFDGPAQIHVGDFASPGADKVLDITADIAAAEEVQLDANGRLPEGTYTGIAPLTPLRNTISNPYTYSYYSNGIDSSSNRIRTIKLVNVTNVSGGGEEGGGEEGGGEEGDTDLTNGVFFELNNTRATVKIDGKDDAEYVIDEYYNLVGSIALPTPEGRTTTHTVAPNAKGGLSYTGGSWDGAAYLTFKDTPVYTGTNNYLFFDINVKSGDFQLRTTNTWNGDTMAQLIAEACGKSYTPADPANDTGSMLPAGRYIGCANIEELGTLFTSGNTILIASAGNFDINTFAIVNVVEDTPEPAFERTLATGDLGLSFPTFTILGAGVRAGEGGKEDIRFGLQVADNAWGASVVDQAATPEDEIVYDVDGVKYGTVVIPKKDFKEGGELTLYTKKVLNIPTEYWQVDITDASGTPIDGDVYTSVVKGVPSADAHIYARGYMLFTYEGVDYVYYTDMIERSVNYVHWKAWENPDAPANAYTFGGKTYTYTSANSYTPASFEASGGWWASAAWSETVTTTQYLYYKITLNVAQAGGDWGVVWDLNGQNMSQLIAAQNPDKVECSGGGRLRPVNSGTTATVEGVLEFASAPAASGGTVGNTKTALVVEELKFLDGVTVS